MTPLAEKRLTALEERIEALEVALVNAQRTGKIEQKPTPNGKRPPGAARPLARVRYASDCGHCGVTIAAGDESGVWYDPADKALYHPGDCASHAKNPPKGS